MRFVQGSIVAVVMACSAAAQTSTSTISAVAGSQAAGSGYTGDGGQATSATLYGPTGIAIDSAGKIYFADTSNHVVRMISAGVITTIAGTGVAGFAGDGGAATGALLNQPNGVAVDSAGNVYIADSTNNRIRKVSNGVITTVAGGLQGFGGDGGVATSAALNFPAAVAVDSFGNIYIADTANHRVRKVTAGNMSTVAGNTNIGFVADNVLATSTPLFAPRGIAVDSLGNFYIADSLNHRIRKVSGGIITTVAGNGSGGYSGDGGSALTAQLNTPRAITVDSSGALYIADTFNHAIRQVTNGTINTAAGTGIGGFNGDGGQAGTARLNAPGGIALDPTGGFSYIADTLNNEIRVINNSSATGIIPHFAAGSTYQTGLYVINQSSLPAVFSATFRDNNGNVLKVPFTGGTTSAAGVLSDTIPAYGVGYYEGGTLTGTTQFSGSASIQSSPSILVQALIRHSGPSGTLYEATVPSSLGSFGVQIGFDATTLNGTQIYTGIALTNMDSTASATVTCVAKDSTGTVIPTAVTVPTLLPLGHWADYVFPALLGKRGTLTCTSTTRVGAIALRFLGTDALSTLPVVLQ